LTTLGKKSKFGKKRKHLKGIDRSSKSKGYDGKSFKKNEKALRNTKKIRR
jgi:hypothetical protein